MVCRLHTFKAAPCGSPNPVSEEDAQAIKNKFPGEKAAWEGRFASHDMSRRQVDENGNITKPYKETKIRCKRPFKLISLLSTTLCTAGALTAKRFSPPEKNCRKENTGS